jgi:copper(I)-binding protein
MRTIKISFLILLVVFLYSCDRSDSTSISINDAWVRSASVTGDQSSSEESTMHSMGDDAETSVSSDQSGVTSAAYMTIKNSTGEMDRLISAESDSARVVEIHLSEMEDGVMTMRPVKGGLEIPSGQQIELKPGGYHIMLIDVLRDLKEGDKVELILHFENTGDLKVQAEVRNP